MQTLSDFYQSVFGCKTYKISLDAGCTCPNRDGTKGTGGCIFCSQAGIYVCIAGVMFSYFIEKDVGGIGYYISTAGIVMYSVAVIFYAGTLWIERDASRRGWKAMQQFGWVSQDQLAAAKKLLWAAGDTYAIALASSALTLIRLLAMRGSRRN